MSDIKIRNLGLFPDVIDNFFNEHPKLKKYKDYIKIFFSNIVFNPNCLNDLEDILDTYYEKMNKEIDFNFLAELYRFDNLNYGFSTEAPIYSLALMYNPKYLAFNEEYVRYFLVLYSAYSLYVQNKDQTYIDTVFHNIDKYKKIFDDLKNNRNELFREIDESEYNNFQYNYAMIIRYTIAYCYYNDYEPEKALEIVRFFMNNYEQIVNSFDVNGFTKDDRAINDKGLFYYFKFYEDNGSKESLKVIK